MNKYTISRRGKHEEIDRNRQDEKGYYENMNSASATDDSDEANLYESPLIIEVQRKLGTQNLSAYVQI